MKTFKNLSIVSALLLMVFFTQKSEAQVRIGGGISIDIGFPEVVVVDRPQRRVPTPLPRRRAPERRPDTRRVRSLGQISNQFRGDNIVKQVVDVEVFENRRGVVDMKAYLQGGDVISFVLENNNFNDVNYHFNGHNNRRDRGNNNRILEVRFNNNMLPLRNGHISLQPQGRNGYTAVLNLHNRLGDSFYGNFSTY